ncbi:hypothetical protein U1Q18_050204 [Sarracenia purpurea var. burkii]
MGRASREEVIIVQQRYSSNANVSPRTLIPIPQRTVRHDAASNVTRTTTLYFPPNIAAAPLAAGTDRDRDRGRERARASKQH